MDTRSSLFDFFKREHDTLIALFEQELKKSKESHDWCPLHLLCENLFELNHHAKEEKYIFEVVKENSKIRSGGPLCTYYFDSHMTNPTLRRAMEATNQATGLVLEPAWSAQMKDIREQNLPLVIPGEDHEAGRIILRGIKKLLPTVTCGYSLEDQKIDTLFGIYIEIQKAHFDREENCFFKMCMDLIPMEKWNQIHTEMCLNYTEIRLSG